MPLLSVFSRFGTIPHLRQLIINKSRNMSTTGMEDVKDFVKNGRKIIGAAVNFTDFWQTSTQTPPENPVMFIKPVSSYVREGSPIALPNILTKVFHEVELGVIIGKRCKNVSVEDAMGFVAGYCLTLDLTAFCDLEKMRPKGYPWSMSKGFDCSTPVSEFIAPDKINDPHNIRLWCKVNGEFKQDSSTKHLLFNIPQMISYVSRFMTLEPNDLFLTGTPMGSSQIKTGDVVECGLGEVMTMKFDVITEQSEN